jgi:hypothetical protein
MYSISIPNYEFDGKYRTDPRWAALADRLGAIIDEFSWQSVAPANQKADIRTIEGFRALYFPP